MKIPAYLGLLLAPLGRVYSSIMRCRRWLYRRDLVTSFQLPGIVVSVGNLEAGGTGKSPVVMALAAQLLREGAHPVILTRGYRSGLKSHESAVLLGERILLAPHSQQIFHADEARMQAHTLAQVPIIIGRDRWAAAQRYLEHFKSPTHWILDDGFQHLRLRRHIDIVLLDAEAPFAQGRCLPAGTLREDPKTINKAQHILLTLATDEKIPENLLNTIASKSIPIYPTFFINGQPRQINGSPSDWRIKKAWILALGIAHPERIIQHCKEQCIPIAHQILVG
ncbi:MAG: tetraacyldisaccharide 4'-kinase, partial [Proteobacteria bacterium]|nr:tetraacyldisaccharide 4'-kinase [Pseudomonadota bacterium]